MSAIEVRALRKEFHVRERAEGLGEAFRALFSRRRRTVVAVDDVSFSIEEGERVGFLGPNGAGKTTTLKMLSGLLHPTSGEVRVAGHVPARREVRFLETITLVMGQKQQLLWDLPPVETWALNRAIYEVPRARFDETVGELVTLLDLGDLPKKPTRELSLGERMKCELVAALVHRPKVLFLDEPTIGLDVTMQAAVRAFVKGYNERFQATLVLTSHDMDDVAALCPRVLVIDRGALSFDGTLEALVRRIRPGKRVRLGFSKDVARADLERYGAIVETSPRRATLDVSAASLPEVTRAMLEVLPIDDLEVGSPPLEEVMGELFARTQDARRAEPG